MEKEEKDILDMLRHYWYVKGIITDEMMSHGINSLIQGINPFRETEFVDQMKANAPSNYEISSNVFKIELKTK